VSVISASASVIPWDPGGVPFPDDRAPVNIDVRALKKTINFVIFLRVVGTILQLAPSTCDVRGTVVRCLSSFGHPAHPRYAPLLCFVVLTLLGTLPSKLESDLLIARLCPGVSYSTLQLLICILLINAKKKATWWSLKGLKKYGS
jgi:hypothetical protein